MEFSNKTMKVIAEVEDKLSGLKLQLDTEAEEFIEEKCKQGWSKFFFQSFYNGGNDYGDVFKCYLFAPNIDASQWSDVSFSHTTHGESDFDVQFKSWLSKIPDDEYIVIEIEEFTDLWFELNQEEG